MKYKVGDLVRFIGNDSKTYHPKKGVEGVVAVAGKELFITFLLKKHGADFKTEVIDPILEEESKS